MIKPILDPPILATSESFQYHKDNKGTQAVNPFKKYLYFCDRYLWTSLGALSNRALGRLSNQDIPNTSLCCKPKHGDRLFVVAQETALCILVVYLFSSI